MSRIPLNVWNTFRQPAAMALNMAQIRDTKWLTLEVCREFQRGTCSRSDQDCKFAHPAKSCQVENGRVIACFDSLKVRREVMVWQCVCVCGLGAVILYIKLNTFSLTDTKIETAVFHRVPNVRQHICLEHVLSFFGHAHFWSGDCNM